MKNIHTSVVLSSDIIRKIVIENKPQETIEKGQIDLLVYLRKNRLHKNVTFALTGLPNIRQVVDTLTPLDSRDEHGATQSAMRGTNLINEQRRRLRILYIW